MKKAVIESIDTNGAGITSEGIKIPGTLPGEQILINNNKLKVIKPAKTRVTPVCSHYKNCGGCTIQHAKSSFIKEWKLNIIESCLTERGIKTDIRPIQTSESESRRRATFHGRKTKRNLIVGFFKKGSHELVSTEKCKLIDPRIISKYPLFRELTKMGATRKSVINIVTTLTSSGLDLNIINGKTLDAETKGEISGVCEVFKIARITWNGDLLAQFSPPTIMFNKLAVTIEPETFLQATEQGQETLIKNVSDSVKGASNVIDLFSGCGTFSLPIAQYAKILAVDKSESMLSTLASAWRKNHGLKEIVCRAQDLFKNPILKDELNLFDTVIIDPPRSGAEFQISEISDSKITRVSSVSCNPKTFSRDAKILIDGGFTLDWVQPIDQFLWSSHIEIVSQFSR
tara:strand:- start:1111 stop:2310 length:1200 start_codon:yes stop_codon:yes gene_type:complete